MSRRIFRSLRTVLPGRVQPASIVVSDEDGGRIIDIRPHDADPCGAEVIDAGVAALLPGFVDSHVHVNEPGRADWEGFECATRAAAAGGVTTLVDMPLNAVPPTTTAGALAAKRAAAEGRCAVDVAFWGGIVPGSLHEAASLLSEGVCGFKCFLTPSGVDEFPPIDEELLHEAARVLASLDATLLVHAEAPEIVERGARTARAGGDPRVYATYAASRPADAEAVAIDRVARAAEQTGARVHIVHVSSAEGVERVRRARARGVRMTAETCPHYLYFAAEDVADGDTSYKCAPPIRDASHREALWRALEDGDLDLVASDHSPSPPSMKALDTGDFVRAWGGIASLQFAAPAVWTRLAARGPAGEGLLRLAAWMSAAPAALAGLDGCKGAIAVGRDADLVVFDPDLWAMTPRSQVLHRWPLTPYAGVPLRGVVRAAYLRGRQVFEHGRVPRAGGGRLLRRGDERR
jgi:allantoinase